MADDDDRQPPQAYDTVAPAGVGAASSNQMSPRAWQDLYLSGDQGLLDVAMEETAADALYQFMESLPAGDVIAGWPDVDGTPPLQTSSPAGVGSCASHSPSFHSPQSSWPSSPDTPLTWGSARLSSGARTPLSQGSARLLTAAGAGVVVVVDMVDAVDVAVVDVVVVLVVLVDVVVVVLVVLVVVLVVVVVVVVVVVLAVVVLAVVVVVVVVVAALVGVVDDADDDDASHPLRL